MVNEAANYNEAKREKQKLDMAEAFNLAYVGSKPSKGNKNHQAYARWQKRGSIRVRKLMGMPLVTVWENVKGSRKL